MVESATIAMIPATPKSLCIAFVSRRIMRNEGQGRITCAIIERAVERGHRVLLITEALSDSIRSLDGVMWLPVTPSRLPTVVFQDIVFARGAKAQLDAHEKSIDVVHVDGCVSFISSTFNAVHYVHNTWLRNITLWQDAFSGLRGVYQVALTAIGSFFELKSLKRSQILIAVSESVSGELVALGFSPAKIRVIPNGVDYADQNVEALRRTDLGVPADAFCLLFAGDLQTSRKNLGTLLKALVSNPAVHLVVAGKVKSRRFPRMAKALGIAERVHFIGFRREGMSGIMAGVDAFVMASHYEPFGLVLLEAMAVGIPVITSQNVGAAGIVGDAGIVIKNPASVKELSHAIKMLVENPAVTRSMGARGLAIVECHGIEEMGSRYVALYEQYREQAMNAG